MQQYSDIYSLQNYSNSFAVDKYLHTVASVGFLFALIILVFALDMSLAKSETYKKVWKIFYHYKPLLRHNSNATDGTQLHTHGCC